MDVDRLRQWAMSKPQGVRNGFVGDGRTSQSPMNGGGLPDVGYTQGMPPDYGGMTLEQYNQVTGGAKPEVDPSMTWNRGITREGWRDGGGGGPVAEAEPQQFYQQMGRGPGRDPAMEAQLNALRQRFRSESRPMPQRPSFGGRVPGGG